MNLGFSIPGLPDKITEDPLWLHMAKKITTMVVIASVISFAWSFLVTVAFQSIYHLDSVVTPQDDEILGQTNAAVDLAMQLVSSSTGRAAEASFGEEVQVETVAADNPFIPLVKPAQEPQNRVSAQAKPEDNLTLKGVAKIGNQYLAIIADANGLSQVIFEGTEFNGWEVMTLRPNTVRLIKGNRSMTLVWEGSGDEA